jgi:hypothetical protein
VAGGVGAAVILPIARRLADLNAEVIVVLGARTRESVLVEEEFAAFAELMGCTDDGTAGRAGTVVDALRGLATAAKSWASCPLPAASMTQPVVRACMTSELSPKIDRAWVATVRAATCIVHAVSSPAILNMFGTISNRPWDAVNVVAKARFCTAP